MSPQKKKKRTQTIIKATFTSETNPRIIIYRKTLTGYSRNIYEIAKTRDLQIIETGLPSFDDEYVIKTDSPEIIHQ